MNVYPFLYIPADGHFEHMYWLRIKVSRRGRARAEISRVDILRCYRRMGKADGRQREKRHVKEEG